MASNRSTRSYRVVDRNAHEVEFYGILKKLKKNPYLTGYANRYGIEHKNKKMSEIQKLVLAEYKDANVKNKAIMEEELLTASRTQENDKKMNKPKEFYPSLERLIREILGSRFAKLEIDLAENLNESVLGWLRENRSRTP